MNEDDTDRSVQAIVTVSTGGSQPTSMKSPLAGITVTMSGVRAKTVSMAGGAVINSIRVGTSGRSIVVTQQPLTKKAGPAVIVRNMEEEDDGPPVLQPQVVTSSSIGQQQPPVLAIPQPKPNSVVLVKTPDGRTLLISNKPQVPGGPCVITYQYVQLPLTGQPPLSQQQSAPSSTSKSVPLQLGKVHVSSANRQPNLIRRPAAVPSVMNDHMYRGADSPASAAQTANATVSRHQSTTAPSAGPGKWLSVQAVQRKRTVQQSNQRSSWYQDEYYEDEDYAGADYFDDYASGGGEYFMEEDTGGGGGGTGTGSTSLYLRGNDGPPELEPMGAVPFLRGVSGHGGHAYRRSRPSTAGYSAGNYLSPRRYQTGTVQNAGAFVFTRGVVDTGDRRSRLQECKTVLNRVVDEVVELERHRKREEAKIRPKKNRTEYWRQYRLKRKLKRMQDDELNRRADLWVREINKRRESIRSVVNHEIQRHITEAAVSKVTNERVRLGWTMPSRPLRRPTPVPEPPSSYLASTSNKRSRYDPSSVAVSGNMNMDYMVGSSNVAPASASYPFGSGAGLYEVGGVIYGDPSVVEETVVDGVGAYYARPEHQQHDEDQRAAEAIMGLAAAGAASTIAPGQQQDELALEQQLHCVCRTPLDRSQFYVMCDLCGRWFHGKCVGITEKKSRQMSTWACQDCQKEKETATQELYCICRTPYDETQPYICCDACDGWYHCQCVGVAPEEADALPTFLCPNCLQAAQGSTSDMTKK